MTSSWGVTDAGIGQKGVRSGNLSANKACCVKAHTFRFVEHLQHQIDPSAD